MTTTWSVAHFLGENNVECVPSSWITANDTKSYWPYGNSLADISKLIRKGVKPELNWATYDIQKLGEYDCFQTANKKAAKAKQTDYLSSHHENEYRDTSIRQRKRKIKKPTRFSASDDSDPLEPSDDSTDYPSLQKKSRASVTRTEPKSSTPRNSPADTIYLQQRRPEAGTQCEDSQVLLELRAFISTQKDFREQVMRQLNTLNFKLNQLAEDIKPLLKSPNVTAPSAAIDQGNSKRVLDEISSLFPIKNEVEVAVLEEMIANEEHFSLLVHELSIMGGHTAKELTKKILYRIFTNEFGTMYTWEGTTKKKQFKSLLIAKCIFEAVRLNVRTSNSCDDEIIEPIKAWFVRAQDRINNKTKKAGRSAENVA